MKLIRGWAVAVAAGFFLLWLMAAASGQAKTAAPSVPAKVQGQAEEAVSVRQDTQKLVDGFARKEASLRDRIESLGRELKASRLKREKAEAYAASERAKVSELARQLKEIERIASELTPFLDETFLRLQTLVAEDLPFLPEERNSRLAAVKSSLNDYEAEVAAKVRRLLEALAIEARYGSTVGTDEAELAIEGGRKRVKLLRLGRLGLFALSLDGLESWHYDPAAKKYAPVHGFARQLNQAAEIAARLRAASLVEIPLGFLPATGGRP